MVILQLNGPPKQLPSQTIKHIKGPLKYFAVLSSSSIWKVGTFEWIVKCFPRALNCFHMNSFSHLIQPAPYQTSRFRKMSWLYFVWSYNKSNPTTEWRTLHSIYCSQHRNRGTRSNKLSHKRRHFIFLSSVDNKYFKTWRNQSFGRKERIHVKTKK